MLLLTGISTIDSTSLFLKEITKITYDLRYLMFFDYNLASRNFLDHRAIKSFLKKSLGGEGCPDFLSTLYDSSYLMVEIVKPSVGLNKKEDPTHNFTHAQPSQIYSSNPQHL